MGRVAKIGVGIYWDKDIFAQATHVESMAEWLVVPLELFKLSNFVDQICTIFKMSK